MMKAAFVIQKKKNNQIHMMLVIVYIMYMLIVGLQLQNVNC